MSESRSEGQRSRKRAKQRGVDEAGSAVVRFAHEKLGVEDEWGRWHDDGFTWWPHELALTVRSSPPTESGGFMVSRVRAESDLLIGVDPESPAFLQRVGVLTQGVCGCAPTLDRARGALKLVSTVTTHAGVVDLSKRAFLSSCASTAACAYVFAPALERMGLGTRAATSGPAGVVRPEPDQLVALYLPLMQATELCAYGVLATAGEGLTAQVPFGDDGGSALVQAQPAEHPGFAAGLRLSMRLPVIWPATSSETLQLLPLVLNGAEAASDMPAALIGSWSLQPFADGWNPVHETFVPSMGFRPGLLRNLVLEAGARSRWAAEELGRVEDVVAWCEGGTGSG